MRNGGGSGRAGEGAIQRGAIGGKEAQQGAGGVGRAEGVGGDGGAERCQRGGGACGVRGVARDRSEIDQIVDHHRCAAGHRAVVRGARADEEVGLIGGGIKVAAGTVFEEEFGAGHELDRGVQISRVVCDSGLVQSDQPVREHGVILQECRNRSTPSGEGTHERTVRATHGRDNEVCGTLRGGDKSWLVQGRTGDGKPGDHQPVPSCDEFGIGAGLVAGGAGGVEHRVDAIQANDLG